MKFHSQEAIIEKLEEVWSDVKRYERPQFEVRILEDKIELDIFMMYDSPGLSFQKLMALAEFFETKAINDTDSFAYGGCETCDYGSKYGFTLTVTPE